jgi:pimeloyl-ACP methyl ester carboxylesterase
MPNNHNLYKSIAGYESAMHHYDNALARITVPYKSLYLQTDYGETHVIVAGSPHNPPVVFFHGLNVNLTTWIDQLNELSPNYYVVAIDSLGNMGRSEAIRPDKHSRDLGIWACQVLDCLNIQQAYCVGLSQGAFLVIKLATVAPHKIKATLLLSCAGIARIRWAYLYKIFHAMLTTPLPQRARAVLKTMTAPDFEPTAEDIHNFGVMGHFIVEHRIPFLRDAEIHSLTAPAWLLMTEHEKTFDPHVVIERAKRLLPNLHHIELVSGVSHSWEENRRLLNDKILDFLAYFNEKRW